MQIRVSDCSSPQCLYFSVVKYVSIQMISGTKDSVSLPADGVVALQEKSSVLCRKKKII